jgi:AcrR family transcriptional regulator
VSRAESKYLPPAAASQDSARDRIVSVATRLFYQRGIRAVGIDLVIAESAVAKTTLYKHFRSKDALIAECLHRLDDRYFRWFENEVKARTDDPHDRLVALFDVLDDWFQRPDFRGCAFINASVELADREHPARDAITNHKRRSRDLIERLAREAGLEEPRIVSDHLMLLMEGAIITALVEGDWQAARRGGAAAARLLGRPDPQTDVVSRQNRLGSDADGQVGDEAVLDAAGDGGELVDRPVVAEDHVRRQRDPGEVA